MHCVVPFMSPVDNESAVVETRWVVGRGEAWGGL